MQKIVYENLIQRLLEAVPEFRADGDDVVDQRGTLVFEDLTRFVKMLVETNENAGVIERIFRFVEEAAKSLIPRRKLIELFSEVPKSVDRETFNSTDWWNHEDMCWDYEANISSFLKESRSWSKDIKVWGDEQGNYIGLIFESGQVIEVEAGVDVRALSKVYIENLCRFARTCDCLLLTEDSILLEADFDLLLHQIGQSKAYSFVSDPVGFLEKIRRG